MLRITHTAAEGTLIAGTSRGDGSGEILKAVGWRWSRTLGGWYVPQSRDRAPKAQVIAQTGDRLRGAGFDVSVEIDNTTRATAEVEADRIARQQGRVDALSDEAERLHAAANAADAAYEALPTYPLGQPILAGHHSEPRMHRDLARRERAMTAAVDASTAATRAAHRASTAAVTTKLRYSPTTVGNRINRIQAEISKLERSRDGYTRTWAINANGTREVETFPAATGDHREDLQRQITELTDQLTYWQNVLTEAAQAGNTTLHDQSTVTAGDEVLVGGTWYTVLRANKKTVTLPTGYSWTQTTPYQNIRGHRPA